LAWVGGVRSKVEPLERSEAERPSERGGHQPGSTKAIPIERHASAWKAL